MTSVLPPSAPDYIHGRHMVFPGQAAFMVDFERARSQMVESQLRAGGVTNAPILAQMRAIPRERFVAANRREVAYIDDVQWLGDGAARRFMASPATLAKVLKLAEITERDAVLDFGAGTGYAAAVIAGLARSVIGIEFDAGLAAIATDHLADLGITNASIIAGDLDSVGVDRFDVIIVQGALDSVPQTLIAGLAERGRLVCLVRTGAVSVAHLLVKSGGRITERAEFSAALPALVLGPISQEFVF